MDPAVQTLIVLGVMALLFVTEIIPLAITSIGGAMALGLLGVIPMKQVFSGLSDFELYSHQVTIVFWQLFGWVGAFVKVQLSADKST